jgi:hypothetical protein
VIAEVEKNGIRLSGLEGLKRHVVLPKLRLSEVPEVFNTAGVVLLTVNSADMAGIADLIARHALRKMWSLSVCKMVSAMPRCCASAYDAGPDPGSVPI